MWYIKLIVGYINELWDNLRNNIYHIRTMYADLRDLRPVTHGGGGGNLLCVHFFMKQEICLVC